MSDPISPSAPRRLTPVEQLDRLKLTVNAQAMRNNKPSPQPNPDPNYAPMVNGKPQAYPYDGSSTHLMPWMKIIPGPDNVTAADHKLLRDLGAHPDKDVT
jgi:hypothetical protein